MILFLCETKSYRKSYISFSLKSKHMLRDIFKGTAMVMRGHVNILILQWLMCGKIKWPLKSALQLQSILWYDLVTVEVVSSGKHLFVLVKTLQSVSEFAFDKCGFTQTNTHVLTHCSVHYGVYVLPRVNVALWRLGSIADLHSWPNQ